MRKRLRACALPIGERVPTITDVARRAGVSATTVSHTVNGTRAVAPATQKRVWAAVRELGYRPNGLARSLRRRETRTIGLIIPDNANPVFADLARAVEDAGFAEGYSVILCNSDRSDDKEAAYVDVLLANRIAGLILASASGNPDALRQVLPAGVRGRPPRPIGCFWGSPTFHLVR